MKKVLLVLVFLVLSSCNLFDYNKGTPIEVAQHGKDQFEVVFLFEKDGLKIYRFFDAGNYRYFSIGNGKFLPQQQRQNKSSSFDGVESGKEVTR